MISAIGIFFVFLLLGMPVAFAIGISGWSFFMIRELPLSILGSPQVLDEFFIFHCTLERGKGKSASLLRHLAKSNIFPLIN